MNNRNAARPFQHPGFTNATEARAAIAKVEKIYQGVVRMRRAVLGFDYLDNETYWSAQDAISLVEAAALQQVRVLLAEAARLDIAIDDQSGPAVSGFDRDSSDESPWDGDEPHYFNGEPVWTVG